MKNVANLSKEYANIIAENLYYLRIENKLKISVIAEKTKIDRLTLKRYESGEYVQNLEKLIILSDFYKVSLLFLFQRNYAKVYNTNEI